MLHDLNALSNMNNMNRNSQQQTWTKRLLPHCLLLPVVIIFPQLAQADTIPDAGSLQQQFDRERRPQLPRRATPDKPAEPAAMPAQQGIMTTVKSFHFAGNTLLSAAELAPVLESYLNRPLDYTQLQEAVAAIANAYREAGWVVRAYLPVQDITEGVVTIQIVEAVFGTLRREGPVASRVKLPTLLDIFEKQQKSGELLNVAAIDRALLLADDLPGVIVAGSLKSGAGDRETDLVIKLGDEPLVTGEVGLDNFGSRSTGHNRLNASINLNSPFSLGDLLNANLNHTEGSDFMRASATLPLGSDGWRVGLNASQMQYKLITAEFSALNAHGTSDTQGLEASYPIIRSRLKNLYFNFNYDHKSYDNQSNGATTTRYQADTANFALNGNLFDNLGGGGANSANLSLNSGQLDLHNSPNQTADAMSTRTAGHYRKLHYAASRQQVITPILSAYAAISGQMAEKNLDSSEKFYLGGPSGVRAYPNSEGGGAQGQLLNLELRWRLAEGITLTGFYDYGRITQNHHNDFTGAAKLNEFSLEGYGGSIAWQTENGPSVKATFAQRIGSNPNPTATGNDQDGSLVKQRFWLTATQQF